MIKRIAINLKLRQIFLFFLLPLIFSYTGCAARTSSKYDVDIPSSGSPITPEWKEYNRQAAINGAPLLRYIVTSKEIVRTRPSKPNYIQNTFSPKNDRLFIFTKWTNVIGKPKYAIRIYDPRGIKLLERERVYPFSTKKWNTWDALYVKGWAAERLPGKWRAEIYMNDVFVTKKEFIIGSKTHHYNQKVEKENLLTIGVFPFLDSDKTNRKHAGRMPLYIAQMLTIDFEDYRVIMPYQFWNYTLMPSAEYNDFKEFLAHEISLSESGWNEVISSHKLDFVITGKVYDPATTDEENEAIIYVIDTKNKNVRTIKTRFTPTQYEWTHSKLLRTFYKNVYSKVLEEGISNLRDH